MEIDNVAKLAQACFSAAPVVVVGSGASAPHGLPGMEALKECLVANVETETSDEEDAWTLVRTALSNGDHLEQALTGKVLPQTLVKKIVRWTWLCVNEKDRVLFLKAIELQERFPLGQLLSALFRSSQNAIDIVTTNYDRVIEYACNCSNLTHSVGFMPGYVQSREDGPPVMYYRNGKPLRCVRIWKVHGSLDWFERVDGSAVSAPLFELPVFSLSPLIVTPGFNKFERTHNEPFRTTIQGADRALASATGYICIGFGFRDTHIEPKIIERCRAKDVPVAVIGRTLTDEAKSFLKNRAGQKYLGIERSEAGARVYSAHCPDGMDLPGRELWSLSGFLTLIA